MTTVFGWIAIAASIPVWLYFFTRVWALFKFIRSGGPTQLKRTDSPGKRLWRVIAEVFGHSHFKGKPLVNAAHWLVMVGFLLAFWCGLRPISKPSRRIRAGRGSATGRFTTSSRKFWASRRS